MAKQKNVSAVLSLKDNMSAVVRGIRKEQSAFKKDVLSTRKALESAYNKKINLRVNNTAAAKKIKDTVKSLQPLRKKAVTAMAVKDMATSRIRKNVNQVKLFGRMVAKPVISIKDNASRALSKIKSGIGGLAKTGLGVLAGAAAGGAVLGGLFNKGATLEAQKISMEHFIGINNKDKSKEEIQAITGGFLNDLRENSNVTPFSSEEVIAAGTRAVGIAGGSTNEAMELVKVAEDMAALTPGKTVSDAMEALADAKNGEMERLKEFNAKVSAEEYKKLGFKGVVDQKLKSQFEGGAAKLSTSGSGLISTIKGKLSSKAADAGLKLVEASKPMLQNAINLIDKFNPKMDSIGNAFKSIFPIVDSIVNGFTTKLLPTFDGIAQKIKPTIEGFLLWLGQQTPFISEIINTVIDAVSTVAPVFFDILKPALDAVGAAVNVVFEAFKLAFPYIKEIVSSVWNFIEPIFGKIGGALEFIGNNINKVGGWLGLKNSEKNQETASTPNSIVQSTFPSNKGNAVGAPYLANIPAYDVGTPYVPQDQLAMVHKGEAIIPAKYNQPSNSNSSNVYNISINGSNMTVEEVINKLIPKLQVAMLNT